MPPARRVGEEGFTLANAASECPSIFPSFFLPPSSFIGGSSGRDRFCVAGLRYRSRSRESFCMAGFCLPKLGRARTTTNARPANARASAGVVQKAHCGTLASMAKHVGMVAQAVTIGPGVKYQQIKPSTLPWAGQKRFVLVVESWMQRFCEASLNLRRTQHLRLRFRLGRR